MTIGLAMIVKDEAPNLPRLAASVRDQIHHWTILDTGSTDDTKEVAKREFGGIPGQIIDHEWDWFGPARTAAMEEARPFTDWVLMLDADEELRGTLDLSMPPGANAIGATVTCAHRPDGRKPRLTRSEDAWTWRGRTHEDFVPPRGMKACIFPTQAFSVVHHYDPRQGHAKALRDLELLDLDLADNPYTPRAVFYKAATLEALGRYDEAIEWYLHRSQMRGDEGEYQGALAHLGACVAAQRGGSA